jgi:hypothetical protein
MRSKHLIPIAVLAFAAACSDTATSPTSAGRPMFLVVAGQYGTGALTNTSIAALPSGGHLQSGSVFCVVANDLSITCSSTGDYFINGVGHTDATGTLNASYSATVRCRNHGGQIVDVKTQFPTTTGGTFHPSRKNGSLDVPPITGGAPTAGDFESATTCPNNNWTKSVLPGTPTLDSFSYTLQFAGFAEATVSISES